MENIRGDITFDIMKENNIGQSESQNREIRMPFTDEELMMFSMIYNKLLRITKQKNIFEGIELKPCKKGAVIF